MILIGLFVVLTIELGAAGGVRALLVDLLQSNIKSKNKLDLAAATCDYSFEFLLNFTYFLLLACFFVPFGADTTERVTRWAHDCETAKLKIFDYVQHPWLAIVKGCSPGVDGVELGC